MEEKYTINNIEEYFKGNIIETAYGFYNEVGSGDGKFEINYSSILTLLIQKAGKICKRYASDLFIDWQSIVEYINKAKSTPLNSKKYLFGFRENGVDHESFVLSRMNMFNINVTEDLHRLKQEIKECYIMEIKINNDDMLMTLKKLW